MDARDLNQTSALVSRLDSIFNINRQYKQLLNCSEEEAQTLLDTFQSLLDKPDLNPGFRRRLIVATQRLSTSSKRYPTCYELRGVYHDQFAINSGGSADIFRGKLGHQKVALKAIRIYEKTDIEHFLKTFDVANGLAYLHRKDIIHGDLKAGNILIDGDGRARLADFGISSVSDPDIQAWTGQSSAASQGGTARWQAPELFNIVEDDLVKNSKASDVYSWSLVCSQIFTGRLPFSDLSNDPAITYFVMQGGRPKCPGVYDRAWGQGLTTVIWNLMQECWDGLPVNRPDIDDVLQRLQPQLLLPETSTQTQAFLSAASFRARIGSSNMLTVRQFDEIMLRVQARPIWPIVETPTPQLTEARIPPPRPLTPPPYLLPPQNNPTGAPALSWRQQYPDIQESPARTKQPYNSFNPPVDDSYPLTSASSLPPHFLPPRNTLSGVHASSRQPQFSHIQGPPVETHRSTRFHPPADESSLRPQTWGAGPSNQKTDYDIYTSRNPYAPPVAPTQPSSSRFTREPPLSDRMGQTQTLYDQNLLVPPQPVPENNWGETCLFYGVYSYVHSSVQPSSLMSPLTPLFAEYLFTDFSAQAHRDYFPFNGDLSFQRGDIIAVTDTRSGSSRWSGRLEGKGWPAPHGSFPGDYVDIIHTSS
ncbi:hypothetical protein H0H87_003678 [Tephrocybe sp. NHM501043]|nr:hypothetical protein H0H87_003678 [Tephrocybe sp. NHM501043]